LSREELIAELSRLAQLCRLEGVNSKGLVKDGLEKLVDNLKEKE